MSISPPPPHLPGASADRRYVDWFMWARGQHLDDASCHAAAAAAVKAEDKSQDALAAASDGVKDARNVTPSLHNRELCYWYVWAVDRKHVADRALQIAGAAALSMERGMTRTQAFDVALGAERGEKVRLGHSMATRLLMDPGSFVLGIAVLALALALFTSYGVFGLLIALATFAVPFRAARFVRRFTPMMAIAALVDLAVIVIVALGIRA
jgi:hypothetical protein